MQIRVHAKFLLGLERQWGSQKSEGVGELRDALSRAKRGRVEGEIPEVLSAIRACIEVSVLHDTRAENSGFIKRVGAELTVRIVV